MIVSGDLGTIGGVFKIYLAYLHAINIKDDSKRISSTVVKRTNDKTTLTDAYTNTFAIRSVPATKYPKHLNNCCLLPCARVLRTLSLCFLATFFHCLFVLLDVVVFFAVALQWIFVMLTSFGSEQNDTNNKNNNSNLSECRVVCLL